MSEPSEFSGDISDSRIYEVLLGNPMVGGSKAVSSKIIAEGELVQFKRGDLVIKENDLSDCVFFIVSGQVSVWKNRRRCDERREGSSVGEMAVYDGRRARNANVIVKSETLVVIRLEGDVFRSIRSADVEFSNRAREWIHSTLNDRFEQHGKVNGSSDFVWLLFSFLVGVMVFCISLLGLKVFSFTPLQQIVLSSTFAVAVVIVVAGRNPNYFWRRLASSSFFAGLGMFVAFQLRLDGGELLGSTSVTVSSSTDFPTLLAGAVFCGVVFIVSAAMDIFSNRN